MKFLKPKFWEQKKSLITFFLLPFSFVYQILFYIKKKITTVNSFEIPIICVGNIYLGGTGKTPLCIFLAKELALRKKYPAIIKKYYKNQTDEHDFIKDKFNSLFLNKNRISAIKSALKKDHNLIILDDGFQDYNIKKDLNIICFNQNQLIGNGMVIPSGPLRESLGALEDAQVVIINGGKSLEFEQKILQYNKNLNIFYSNYYPVNSNEFKKKKLLAVAGIANPKNFFDLLLKEGLEIKKKMIFPDHYQFKKSEIVNIVKYAEERNLQIVMTEKDYFKVKKFNFNEIKYLKIMLKIENCEKLIKLVSDKYD